MPRQAPVPLIYDVQYHASAFLQLNDMQRWLDADPVFCVDVFVTLLLCVLRHVRQTQGENVDGKLSTARLTDDVVPALERKWVRAAADLMCWTKNGWQKLARQRRLQNAFDNVIPLSQTLYLPYDPNSSIGRVLVSLWVSAKDAAGCCSSVHLLKSVRDLPVVTGTLPSTLELVRCDVDALRAASWAGHRLCLAALCCSGRWEHLVKEARDTKTSPLHITALCGHTHCVQFLLNVGYDVNTTENGVSARYLARVHDLQECAEFLQRRGGLNIVDGQVQDHNCYSCL